MLRFPFGAVGFFFIVASFARDFLLLLFKFLMLLLSFLFVFLVFLLVFLRFLTPFGSFFLFQLFLFPLALLCFAFILSGLFGRCGSFAFGLLLGLFPFDLCPWAFSFMPSFSG